MGSSESKLATVSTPKPEPQLRIKNQRVAELADPRSPTTGIDRTPIQLAGAVSKTREGEQAGSSVTNDPRSPTHGISRTPLKDSMRVTVSSFARRLGMLFLNESSVDEAAALPHVTFTKHVNLPVEELGTTEPLLATHRTQDYHSCDGTTVADVHTPSQGYGSLVGSPFLLIGEMEVPADLSLEEAEDALVVDDAPTLIRELSLSLMTCHDGVHPSQICEEDEEDDGHLVPALSKVAVGEQGHEDHAYALPSVSTEPVSPLPVVEIAPEPEVLVEETAPEVPVVEIAPEVEIPVIETVPVVETAPEPEIAPEPEVLVEETVPVVEIAPDAEVFEEPVQPTQPEVTEEPEPIPQQPSPLKTSVVTAVPATMLQPQAQVAAPAHTGIKCPTFDTKSPSQVVFKPQWLGVGFGATGVKPRGVQGRGKGGSSPLTSRKSTGSENQGLNIKPKHRGKALGSEGRSPMQLLREANSPRENVSQKKLKISTPDRQRLGQLDRRALMQSINKENQR
ncbi:hypothetical protein ACEWY4_019528 [Coilia grayii]|uniref:Cell division cycle-associated protein 3 n=1 Tax=Coilia grayii TaxID=363190 RepID=A0ABD1JBQ4_9TELE